MHAVDGTEERAACETKTPNTTSCCQPTLVCLFNHLMADYQKSVRPVRDWKQPTDVSIDIMIYSILNVDEKNQVLTTYIWYRQIWKDEFLIWDPEDFDNVTQVSVPTDKIWVPDILINEFVDVGKSPDIPYVYVKNTGHVKNYKPIQVVTACSLDIYSFPFDMQNCTLTFTSWLHKIQDINIRLVRTPEEVQNVSGLFMDTGEWELLSVIPKNSTFEENNDTFAEMKFFIIIKRRPLFYVVNLLLPSMFLMFMDVMGFYLPPDSGERVSFKITLLLGYSVFLIIVSDTLPVTANGTPLIGVYFAVCMALLVLSLTETILIVRLVHKQDLQPPVPKWVKRLVLDKLTAILCISDKKRFAPVRTPSSDGPRHKENSNSTAKLAHYTCEPPKDYEKSLGVAFPQQDGALLVDSILHEVTSIRQFLEKRDEYRDIAKEWLQVGYVVDLLLFRVYLVALSAYTITLCTMWSLYSNGGATVETLSFKATKME
ncbi:5-hydroxytryptamine receptor 3A-like isoform X2 [Ambystoma mexicanum]|uniref:5-hydroxytryptamine receptor 3A-like isoform X2 n=1 Tax=Ambystoma mexicanum TaxID=8296 RepID=UPI0037E8FA61